MRFGDLYLATLLWVFPIMLFFYFWMWKARKKRIEGFADKTPLDEISETVSVRRKKIKIAMILTALLFMLITFLRPQFGFTWQEVKRQGLDIIIAIDTSNSMLAEDVKPNRLERSKLAIKDLVKKLRGDRLGLVAFSGTAFLQCPLTIDYNGFLLSLEDITADIIPVGGTSIANAIDTSIGTYETKNKKNKILIIITDGEDLEGGLDRAIAKAKAANVTVFCVGIGTPEGEIIPIKDKDGKITFLKNEAGEVVRTKLDEETLKRIAIGTGGMYVRSTGAEFGLDLIYDQRLANLVKEDFKSRMEKKYNEQFQYPLSLVFLLLLLETLVGDRRSEKTHEKNNNNK